MLNLIDYLRLRKNDSTLILAREAEMLAMEIGDDHAALSAVAARGLFLNNQGKRLEAKAVTLQGLRDALTRDVKTMIPDLQNNLAVIYRRLGQRDSAFYYWSEAEIGYASSDRPYEVWRVYLGIANLYWEREEFDEAEEYLQKAFDLTATRPDGVDHGYIMFQLAHFYFTTERFEKFAAIRTQWDERQLRRKTSKELMELPEHTSLLYLFGEIKPDVVARLQRAGDYYRQKGDYFHEAWTLENLGFYLHQTGAYQRAAEVLEGVLPVYQASNTTVRAGTVQYELYQIYRERGDLQKAVDILEDYMLLKDSLRSAEVERNLADLQVQYETEKKEQQLQIQQLEITQKTQQRNILLMVSLLLGLAAVVIFLGYRQRLRVNRQLSDQAAEIQAQKIRQLEQENELLSLNAMIEGQESERLRIAQDLHDGIGGLLTTVKAHFYAIREQVEKLEQLNIYQKTNNLINEACREVRRISQNMMPGALQLLGLQGAIEDLATQLRQNGLVCELEMIGLEQEPDRTRKIMIFRIVQELCNNISKHAGARQVFIQLLKHQDTISLIVEDDGIGFDYEQYLAGGNTSLGLKNIESRVRFLKGSWEVDSVPGEGTTVMIRIPLSGSPSKG